MKVNWKNFIGLISLIVGLVFQSIESDWSYLFYIIVAWCLIYGYEVKNEEKKE